ncbi:GMC family oxidoreductase [Metabacillus elymi]|uniref:GMC family oxidoreductase n=1 Tax=Metabacillus elymi TaxID=2745198 RepID=A0ABX6S9I2_9BACI|nr:GMC family oxidoreductase [Metabacillus sp. KUDC1714]QNF30036.1 GMC family oxidoreductase [Metabacillus sp. KUDC1714]
MPKKEDKKYFDYIVIGAGTAGGVIAKELTDDKKTSLLVLEAGTNMRNELSSASNPNSGLLATDNRHSFNIMSTIEPNINSQLRISSGRAIGGSSEHNAMYAVRGSRELYDQWGELVGPQWEYDNISSLFKKNETYTGKTQEPEQRGTNGPIFVRQQIIPKNGLTITLAKATSTVLGIPIVEDYNTGIRNCTFYKSQAMNKKVGGKFVRSSTATGYLNENIVIQGNEFHPDEFGVGRRKLVILAKTTVNKILFKRKRGVNIAVGVKFVRNGVSEKAFARKGIIVSAGNFSSVILQRSGIGNSMDLARIGVSTLIENPNVGHNFQAQFTAGVGVEVETSRLLDLRDADPDLPFPLGAHKGEGETGGRRLQLYSSITPSFLPPPVIFVNNWAFDPNKKTNVMSIGPFDNNPRSRGTILAAHSDPEVYPSVNLNPLQDSNDLEFMIDQYIEIYKIMKKAQELDPEGIYKLVYPDEKIFMIKNNAEKRAEIAKYVKATYRNIQHFGGQCRMAKRIQDGVVDGYLNVFGTKNLKVADLSISPILPDGNTSIPSQMIGLACARFIQENFSPYVLVDEELEELEELEEFEEFEDY